MQEQKNRVELQGNNLHFPFFLTIQNANYSPEPRLCFFVASKLETSLLGGSIKRVNENLIKGQVKSDSLTSHLSKQNKTCYRLRLIGGLTTRPDLVVLTSWVGVLLSGDP